MHVSRESSEETSSRLMRVLGAADFRLYDGYYGYHDYPANEFPAMEIPHALALVRDEQIWSVLRPFKPGASERSRVFVFHFPPGLDNSGFVGWLASHLKTTFGTGVCVVCGHNDARGGIFDYWCVPASIADAAIAEVQRLRGFGQQMTAPP